MSQPRQRRRAEARLRIAAAVVAATTAIALPAAMGSLSTASGAARLVQARSSQDKIPSKFIPAQLAAVPHSQTVASLGYKRGSTTRYAVSQPKGKGYVLRLLPKDFYAYQFAVASAKGYWTVGARQTSSSTTYRVLHFAGKKWVTAKLPSLPTNSSLEYVAASSPSNVWVGGNLLNDSGQQQLLHYNGKSWKLVPFGQTDDYGLDAIATSSSKNLWASEGPYLYHYNGKAWKQLDDNGFASTKIATSSSGDAWFIGTDVADNKTAAQHWNGKSFHVLKVSKNDNLLSVAVMGDAAWISGYSEVPGKVPHAFVLRSTGSSLKSVALPKHANSNGVSVAATSKSSAVLYESYQTGHSCTTYRSHPIFAKLSAKKATSVQAGTAYLSGCG